MAAAALVAVCMALGGCSTASSAPRPAPTPSPVRLNSCGAILGGVDPTVPGIASGTIDPGHGVAGIEIGMTRDQVIARVGLPVCDVADPPSLGSDIWDFARPALPGQPPGDIRLFVTFGDRVDIHPKARVTTIVAAGSGFTLPDGSPAFLPGSYDHLAKLYSGRIQQQQDGDTWNYRLSPAPGDAPGTETAFHGSAPGPDALNRGTVSIG